MFRNLRTKLLILYGGVFSLALLFLGLAAQFAIIAYAKQNVQNEMGAATSVFTRLWSQKSEAIKTNAELLARDFGFKSALANGDLPTVASAFDNLRSRVQADEGLIVAVDGTVLAGAQSPIAANIAAIVMDAQPIEARTGIITVNGQAYSTVIAPVLAPDPMGWVVFALRVDRAQMKGLETLSSIPLDAAIISPDAKGIWRSTSGDLSVEAIRDLSGFAAHQKQHTRAEIVPGTQGQIIAVATALPGLNEAQPSLLLLSYPLNKALSSYQTLLFILMGLGGLTLCAVILASLFLARTLTRPILMLNHAAEKLKAGETELVTLHSKDEIADLAATFNAMAVSIHEREQRILHMARHDLTTDLPNRAALEDRIGALTDEGGRPLIYAIGVERFSHIRSIWGMKTSNGVINALSDLLRDLDPDALIGRLGPDVIGMVLPRPEDTFQFDLAPDFAATLVQKLDARVSIDDQMVDIGVVIGYDPVPQTGQTAAEYIEKALIALDQARTAKVKTAAFDPKTYDELADNVLLTDELHSALDNEDLMTFYQPKYDYRLGRVTAAEALVRWDHATRGMVSPQRFVLLAEETGFIRDLTLLVLKNTLRDQAYLKSLGFDIAMSVNYSGRLLTDRDYTEQTLAICAQATGKLCLEITETAVIEDPTVGLAAIERFVAAGIEVSLDDFGTGLSSLSYLKMIPAQELKIDRSFIMEMEKGQRERLLVAATINLAHGLGMKVTAEGVEDDTALALLAGMGCDMAQGYGIARPMPIDALEVWLRACEAQPRKYDALTAQ
ncbi:EAL domain-containing protein [Asticcacaulis sp. BYS171W]|uniref:EAL domain-containing protein n=1 Tax=Asticcacaulis aquaticus TaxID=2984212 RepID=A0ABT5HS03_9CAUL|nr:GGDEF domain-containing phosphodiesterase [Asticcacaulis aquaticus]MDC7682610.1 EAL domain-containing protein [Asticcacaulis aquaticus]